MNMQTVRNDLRSLHERQKGMLNSLEMNFLVALPESIKKMSVKDFLGKFEGNVTKMFAEVHSD